MMPALAFAILGAGGHAAHVIDIAIAAGACVVEAFDDHTAPGTSVLGVKVAGPLEDAFAREVALVIAIGDPRVRSALAGRAERLGIALPRLVHPRASLAASAELGFASVVDAGAAVDARAVIARGAIVDACASVGHDAHVGAWVHLESGSRILPGARVADFVKVSANAVVLRGAVVPEGTVVPPGAVFG
jgi:UDP-3-O-[3-hydroxymyristoyl] glucosamine N-acyltransferase